MKIEEQYQDLLEKFPEIILTKRSYLILSINKDVDLIINVKRYPKKPRAKLINANGKQFSLSRISTILREWDNKSPPMISVLIDEILIIVDSLLSNQIIINKSFLEGLMNVCKNTHPRKLVGLLSVKKRYCI